MLLFRVWELPKLRRTNVLARLDCKRTHDTKDKRSPNVDNVNAEKERAYKYFSLYDYKTKFLEKC